MPVLQARVTCPGECGHTQPGDNVSGTLCPGVLCYPAPLALCWCFPSVVRASLVPSPKSLLILHLVIRSFHKPNFPRTLKSVSSDTADSLYPSMLKPEPCMVLWQLLSPVQLCPGRCLYFRPHNSPSHSLSAITGSQDTSVSVSGVIFDLSGHWLCALKRS